MFKYYYFYQKIPKSGYINVFDYKTPKDLADYLLYLSNNSTAYNSYFKWKKFVRYVNRPFNPDPFQHKYLPLCEMCIKLQLESHFGFDKSSIGNLDEYWRGNDVCEDPSKHSIMI